MPESGPIGEERRMALLNRLCKVLGDEEARTLMESLPAVYWGDLATKDDVFVLKDDIRASEERIRTEMAAEFKMLRAENKEFRGEMALQFAKQTRTMVFTMLAFAVPTWGSILAVGLT